MDVGFIIAKLDAKIAIKKTHTHPLFIICKKSGWKADQFRC